jgi:hypothetical protein
MKAYLCFYTNEKFRNRESFLKKFYEDKGFIVIPYHSEKIKSGEFYDKNKQILDCPVGDGYWLWKPKIILDTFNQIDDGDIVVYTDAGDMANIQSYDVVNYFENNDYYFSNWNGYRTPQKLHTKRDCFVLMNCDTEIYHNTAQIEAGFFAVKKTNENISLMNEYLNYCSVKQIVDDEDSKFGNNFENWQFHRHDQSILTNLIIKNKLNFSSYFDRFISYNIHKP